MKARQIIAAVLLLLCISGCSVILDSVDEEELASQLRNFEIGQPAFDPDDPLLQRRAILISGEFNFSVSQTVCRQLAYLDQQSPSQPIHLLINSTGGDGKTFQAITNMINSISAPVNIVNYGMCASYAATLIQSATGKRIAQKDTIFLIHDVSSNHDDFKKFYSEQQLQIFKTKCNLPADWLPLKKDYTFTAEEALNYNFVDEVVDKIEL